MNRQKILNILLAALLLSVVFLAWSNATRYGNRAQKGGNYVLAKMWYLIAAHSGDGAAQNNLAGFYAEGLGGDRSDRLAVKWFEKAAAAGVSAATFNLSNFYEETQWLHSTSGISMPRGAMTFPRIWKRLFSGTKYLHKRVMRLLSTTWETSMPKAPAG